MDSTPTPSWRLLPVARRKALRLSAVGLILAALIAQPALTEAQAPDERATQDAAPAAPATERAAAPVDSRSHGSRRAVGGSRIPLNLYEGILAGGPLMIPIFLCSFVAMTFGLERLVVLRRRRVIPRDFVSRFLNHLEQGKVDRQAAITLCEENGSPIAAVFEHGVRKWGKPGVEVEQAIIDGGERQVNLLRKNIRILNGVATISPLLGLLGTVVGIIMCFNEIANSSAMGKAEQLAAGIGIALITTAGGLAVAIPSIVLYMYLVGRVESLVMEMDSLGQKVVNLISAEALSPPVNAPPALRALPRGKPAVGEVKDPREVRA